MRPTFTVDLQDSLEIAAGKLRENGCAVLPVTERGSFAGAITESTMVQAMAQGMALGDPIEPLVRGALSARVSDTGAEALRLFEREGASVLIVIDESGQIHGILTPTDLYPKRIAPPRPPMVGGMATPFGVHLTTGSIRAGVSDLALISTGAVLFTLLFAANLASNYIARYLHGIGLATNLATLLDGALAIGLFLVGMRVIPLSGIHAAEHKVVHAIERGEDLTVANVRRMPRVHPRCGTNLAVGASVFLGLSNSNLIPISEVKLLFAAIATLVLWKPLGNTVQYYVTTKPPTKKQLEMGIRSGRQLLKKYATYDAGRVTIWHRLYNSGMFHVVAGSMLTLGLFSLIIWAFKLPISL